MPNSEPAAAKASQPRKARKLPALRGRQVGLADDEVLPIGTAVSRYTISGEPFDGPAGPLYPARDSQNLEEVTLWPLPILLARADSEVLKAIQQEARRAARLEHPLLLRPINIGRERGLVYMVLEPYPADCLEDAEPLSATLATHVVREVAGAVAVLHQCNLLHRDLRPANLRLDPDGSLSLTGLGLVRAAEFLSQVRTGSPAIDPHYVGPELSPDRRSDVYALGATYYFLLTGRRPFEGVPFEHLVEAHRSAAVPDPARFVPGLPPECGRVIRKAMAKNPRERFPDMVEFAAELGTLLESLRPAETVGGQAGPQQRGTLSPATDPGQPSSANPAVPSATEPAVAAGTATVPPTFAVSTAATSGVVPTPVGPTAPVPPMSDLAAELATQEVPRPLAPEASQSTEALSPTASVTVASPRPAGFGESYTSMALSALARRSASLSGEISAPISTAGRTRGSLSHVDVDAWMDLSDTLAQSTLMGGTVAASDSAGGTTTSGRASALGSGAGMGSVAGPFAGAIAAAARVVVAPQVTPMSGSGTGLDAGSSGGSVSDSSASAGAAGPPAPTKQAGPLERSVLSNSAELELSDEQLKVLSNSQSGDIVVPSANAAGQLPKLPLMGPRAATPAKEAPPPAAPAKLMGTRLPGSAGSAAAPTVAQPNFPKPTTKSPAKPAPPQPGKAARVVDSDYRGDSTDGPSLLGQAFFAAIMGFIMVAAVVLAALILTGRLRI